jgi:hypothetical protein
MCCHPALTRTSAIALTLRAVAGLTTAEIAHAFLVPEATMAQRISRAKQLIKKSGTGFHLPSEAERDERLETVLHVLYLTVETTLQVSATTPRPGVAPLPKKPVPRLVRRAAPQRTHFGFDFGPLLRMSSLGSTRIVPGGGLGLPW